MRTERHMCTLYRCKLTLTWIVFNATLPALLRFLARGWQPIESRDELLIKTERLDGIILSHQSIQKRETKTN